MTKRPNGGDGFVDFLLTPVNLGHDPRDAAPVHASRDSSLIPQELEGVIRNGVVELTNGKLPEGTRVQVRAKRS
ncbi:MAG: hypothetical protein WCF74_19345 [Candidatus Sulfotelmatobacter sp.]